MSDYEVIMAACLISVECVHVVLTGSVEVSMLKRDGEHQSLMTSSCILLLNAIFGIQYV